MVKQDAEMLLTDLKGELNKFLQREMELNSELSYLKIQINKIKNSIVEAEKLKRMLSISNDEKIILKNLKIDWKYIARDNCGSRSLCLYEERPEFDLERQNYDIVGEGCWLPLGIYNHLFTFIKPGECYRIIDIIN